MRFNNNNEKRAFSKCMNEQILDNEEKDCLNHWFLRHCINSDYYYLNFLLIELTKNNKNFNMKNEQYLLGEFFFGDYGNSIFHKLWIALYFLKREMDNN
jgi:hypothetical protein